MLRSKSPLIMMSLELDVGDNADLAEVLDSSEASEDDSDFQLPPKRSGAVG